MSNINNIITEISLDDVVNHIQQHKDKYLTGLLGLGIAVGGHHGYNFLKNKIHHHKLAKESKLIKNRIKNHLNKHRETYAGAAIGGLSSLASSSGANIGSRLRRGAIGSIFGGLVGSGIENLRKDDERNYDLKINNLLHNRGK